MLAIEEGNSVSKKRLKLYPEVAVITIVNFAFGLSIGMMLGLKRVNSDINEVLLISDTIHLLFYFYLS